MTVIGTSICLVLAICRHASIFGDIFSKGCLTPTFEPLEGQNGAATLKFKRKNWFDKNIGNIHLERLDMTTRGEYFQYTHFKIFAFIDSVIFFS